GEFEVAEFLEAFGFNELVEDGALAFAGEGDLLVGPLDALLNPPLLRAVGDVQKFDPQGLAVGTAQDGDDLAQRAEFEAKDLVEKDRAIEIGLGETVGARIKFLLVVRRRQAERIEVGVDMAAGPISAYQHEGANRVARGAVDVRGGNVDAPPSR